MQLRYAIKYVADMDRAVAWHRDVLGLTPRFTSPGWSEFDTGGTTLALHMGSDSDPAGSVRLGFATDDLAAFYAARETSGVTFTDPPRDVHGSSIARLLDSEGAETNVSG